MARKSVGEARPTSEEMARGACCAGRAGVAIEPVMGGAERAASPDPLVEACADEPEFKSLALSRARRKLIKRRAPR